MSLRFYFDECSDEKAAHALIGMGIDVVTVSGLQRKGLSDQEHLQFALLDNRVVYSVDRDFLRIANDYLQQGIAFAGLAYHAADARTRRQIIDALALLDGVYEPPDMMNRIEFI